MPATLPLALLLALALPQDSAPAGKAGRIVPATPIEAAAAPSPSPQRRIRSADPVPADTADLYRRIGFCEPWVGCGAGRTGLRETHGGGTFRHRQDRAAGHGNRGFSTLPQYNASTTGLQYQGFTYSGQAHDPGARPAWEWRV